jgi:hypothetical protein
MNDGLCSGVPLLKHRRLTAEPGVELCRQEKIRARQIEPLLQCFLRLSVTRLSRPPLVEETSKPHIRLFLLLSPVYGQYGDPNWKGFRKVSDYVAPQVSVVASNQCRELADTARHANRERETVLHTKTSPEVSPTKQGRALVGDGKLIVPNVHYFYLVPTLQDRAQHPGRFSHVRRRPLSRTFQRLRHRLFTNSCYACCPFTLR